MCIRDSFEGRSHAIRINRVEDQYLDAGLDHVEHVLVLLCNIFVCIGNNEFYALSLIPISGGFPLSP